jgi:hypothetical protein
MDDVTRAAFVSAGVVLLQPLFRRFAAWLFETVTRRMIFALGWLVGALWLPIASACEFLRSILSPRRPGAKKGGNG